MERSEIRSKEKASAMCGGCLFGKKFKVTEDPDTFFDSLRSCQ